MDEFCPRCGDLLADGREICYQCEKPADRKKKESQTRTAEGGIPTQKGCIIRAKKNLANASVAAFLWIGLALASAFVGDLDISIVLLFTLGSTVSLVICIFSIIGAVGSVTEGLVLQTAIDPRPEVDGNARGGA